MVHFDADGLTHGCCELESAIHDMLGSIRRLDRLRPNGDGTTDVLMSAAKIGEHVVHPPYRTYCGMPQYEVDHRDVAVTCFDCIFQQP